MPIVLFAYNLNTGTMLGFSVYFSETSIRKGYSGIIQSGAHKSSCQPMHTFNYKFLYVLNEYRRKFDLSVIKHASGSWTIIISLRDEYEYKMYLNLAVRVYVWLIYAELPLYSTFQPRISFRGTLLILSPIMTLCF